MIHPPAYFSSIQHDAATEWEKLEGSSFKNAVLHLFSEIQSPQHVLSELLQNADDAGATWARASIHNECFIFEHNGEDFAPDQLRALCQFGVSSKPQLHTIGFRGIGFKSVFSFGDEVAVHTPSLSMRFVASRFTVPEWVVTSGERSHTRVEIPFKNLALKTRAEQELQVWRDNPTPLIFFNNISRLDIDATSIVREHLGPGPAAGSEWIRLTGDRASTILHVVSEELPFPADALEEIAQERRVGSPEDLNIQGCRVELAIQAGSAPRLYVVLPTAVFPEVPFSSNAPFVQDPARKQIKDPDLSPTNQWLLKRIGELAAETMLGWLNNPSLTVSERVKGYRLLPDPITTANQVNHHVSQQISSAFWSRVAGAKIVLNTSGELVASGCAALPAELHNVWSPDVLRSVLDLSEPNLASSEISAGAIRILHRQGRLNYYDHDEVVITLRQSRKEVPNPGYQGLEHLWAYMYRHDPDAQRAWRHGHKSLPVVPAEGESGLRRASNLLVLTSRSSLFLDDDLRFLSRFASLADRNWIQHLSANPEGPRADEQRTKVRGDAQAFLASLGLNTPSGVDEVLNTVSRGIFGLATVDSGAAHRFAWIVARTGNPVPQEFRFECENGVYRRISENLLVDVDGSLTQLLPENWAAEHLVSERYEQGRSDSERRIWRNWLTERGGVRTFPMPQRMNRAIHSREALEQFCASRGGRLPERIPYQSPSFIVRDVDFDSELWGLWQKLAIRDTGIWPAVFRRLAAETPEASAAAFQVPQSKWHPLDAGEMVAGWVVRLRNVPCLIDTQANPALPSELMRTTPESASLQGIERFVHSQLDRVENRWLLDLLGVRTDPSPDVPLERLEALSRSRGVPITVIANLYQILDRLSANLSGDELQQVRERFQSTPLILAENNSWHRSAMVVQTNDARIGGILSIHPDVAQLGLMLWERLGVARRATTEQVIASMLAMPKGDRVDDTMIPVVHDALASNPEAIWFQCNAWIDLSGYWRDRGSLSWTLRDAEGGRGLYSRVRHSVADLTMIPESVTGLSIEAELPSILPALDRRVVSAKSAGRSQPAPAWLQALGTGLERIPHPDDPEQEHPDYESAAALRRCEWQPVASVSVAPYLDGHPAGEERKHRALWSGDTVYVAGRATQYHDELVHTLGAGFRDPAIRRAIAACVGRDPGWIEAYLGEQFELLDPPDHVPEPVTVTPVQDDSDVAPTPTRVVVTRPTGSSSPEPDTDQTQGPPSAEDRSAEFGQRQDAGSERKEEPDAGGARSSPTGSGADRSQPSTSGVGAATEDSQQRPSSESSAEGSHPLQRPGKREIIMAFLQKQRFSEDPDGVIRDSIGKFVKFDTRILDAIVWDHTGKARSGYWVGDRSLKDGFSITADAWSGLFELVDRGYLVLPRQTGADEYVAYLVSDIRDRIELSPTVYRIWGAAPEAVRVTNTEPEIESAPEIETAPEVESVPEAEAASEVESPINFSKPRRRLPERVIPRPPAVARIQDDEPDNDVEDRDSIFQRIFGRKS